MVQIIDKPVALKIPTGEPCPILLAQLPNRLGFRNFLYQVADPAEKGVLVRSTLELVASGEGGLHRARFVVFPEGSIPFRYKDELLKLIEDRFAPNTVIILGFEHITYRQYWQLLSEYRACNEKGYELVLGERREGQEDRPVNWCMIAVKDDTGKLDCYLEAKTHPFFGEEFLDEPRDLYRGKHIYLFRSTLIPFNFIVLICLDYIYRNLHGSNITAIIQRTNQMFLQERQHLDLLFIIQSNPKPEHKVFQDVVSGFYAERLIFTPGVKNAITIFLNSSGESAIQGLKSQAGAFGHSAIVLHKNHRLPSTSVAEYRTDDFHGEPVSRLRFGRETRLYLLDLSLFHQRDPRTSRLPVKILGIWCWGGDRWRRLEGEEIITGIGVTFEKEP